MSAKLMEVFCSLPRALRSFLFLACALTTLSLGSAMVWRHLGYGLPYSFAYYFVPDDMFSDFKSFGERFALFGTPDFFVKPPGAYLMYPAPLIYPIALFYRFHDPVSVFLAFLAITVLAGAWLLFQVLRRAGMARPAAALFTGVTVVTSYPMLLLVQRGNFEVLVWIFVSLGVLFVCRRQYGWAGIVFGVATALKLYPFIFLGLLVAKSRVREVLLAVAVAAGTTVLALWGLGPTLHAAYRWNSIQLAAFGKYYAASDWSLGYDHSLFSLVKLATLAQAPDLTTYVRPYMMCAAVGGLLLFVLLLWRMPTVNQIVVLSVLAIVIPPVSYDYTLLELYGAFAVLCVIAVRARGTERLRLDLSPVQCRALTAYFTLFALVLTPESYAIVGGARFGGQFRCICLVGVIVLALAIPLPEVDQALLPKPVQD